MGGGDVGLKAIAKRQKQNGLGRLRLYCQMCEKQCRDENGFKCHVATPAHQRNLALFASQPELFVDRFSKQFLAGFLGVLHQRYGSNPVAANTVYQDYIKDKEHVHMNSTQWTTLSEFAKDLGRRGICRVEERDGALWVVFIDRDAMARKQRAQELDRMRLDDEERAEKNLATQMQLMEGNALHTGYEEQTSKPVPLTRIDISMSKMSAPLGERAGHARACSGNAFKSLKSSRISGTAVPEGNDAKRRPERIKKPSVLDEIMADDVMRERYVRSLGSASVHAAKCAPVTENADNEANASVGPANADQPEGERAVDATSRWLHLGTTVKCVAKALEGGHYFNKKGVVESLKGEYTAIVRLKDSGAVLELDQDDLETVLPKPGGKILFVRGERRGRVGTLARIDESSYSACICLDVSREVISGVEYDFICKWTPS
jgi:DNA/RNA-binding protein KIN17